MDFSALSTYLSGLNREIIPFYDCMVLRDHQLLFRQSGGLSRPDRGQETSPEDLYWIYSMTKVVTATAVMQLAEKGLLGLEDPVSRYLPEYGCLTVGPERAPARNPLTLRHLLTMQGGLSYDMQGPPLDAFRQPQKRNASTREVIRALAGRPLSFEPGTHFLYSLCHDVLGAVVEEVSGLTFSAYLKKHIFEPLAMDSTGFFPTAEQEKRFCAQYVYCPEAERKLRPQGGNAYRFTEAYESGGAGLFTTCRDYSLLADALSCGGTGANGARILRPETIDKMRTPQLAPVSLADFFLPHEREGYSYGLGVRTLTELLPGLRGNPGEFGWDGAAGSYVLMDPAIGLTVVYFQSVLGCTPVYEQVHPTIRQLTYKGLEEISCP